MKWLIYLVFFLKDPKQNVASVLQTKFVIEDSTVGSIDELSWPVSSLLKGLVQWLIFFQGMGVSVFDG